MNEKETIEELGLLKARFDKAGKPLLPSSLSSGELFRRVDADRIRLDREDTTPEKTGKVVRFPARTAAIAAAVLLVVGAFAVGHRVLFAGNDGHTAVATSQGEDPAARERDNLPEEQEPYEALPGLTATPPAADPDTVTGENEEAAVMQVSELPEAGEIEALLKGADWKADDLRGAPEAASFELEGKGYAIDREACVLYDLSGGRAARLTSGELKSLTALLG